VLGTPNIFTIHTCLVCTHSDLYLSLSLQEDLIPEYIDISGICSAVESSSYKCKTFETDSCNVSSFVVFTLSILL